MALPRPWRRAARNYQILRHFDESPQLPMGSILPALPPPRWFAMMHRRMVGPSTAGKS